MFNHDCRLTQHNILNLINGSASEMKPKYYWYFSMKFRVRYLQFSHSNVNF